MTIETRQHIEYLLSKYGYPINLHGYDCALEAIALLRSLEYPSRARLFGKAGVYECVGKKLGVRPQTVERRIRHGIEVLYQQAPYASLRALEAITGGHRGKAEYATNKCFLVAVARELRRLEETDDEQ